MMKGCMDALKSARSWFDVISESPEDEADGFAEEAKNVVDAAYFAADCALATPAPKPTECPAHGKPEAEVCECGQLRLDVVHTYNRDPQYHPYRPANGTDKPGAAG